MSDSGQLEMNTCKFTWKLKDFSKRCKQSPDVIESPIVKIESEIESPDASHWNVLLYPFGDRLDSEGYLSLFLNYLCQEEIQVYFEFILSNVTGAEIARDHTFHKFCAEDSLAYGFPRFYKRDDLVGKRNNLLIDDTLIVTFTIHVNVCNEHEVNMKDTILDSYESLFLNGTFSDLTITIKKKKIYAHKSILSVRSNVFAAMFDHDMIENNTNTLTITDVSYEIMNEMLLFIYSGKVKDLKKNSKLLLPAAEKYEILELKALCEENLWKNIKFEDACEVLIIADLYNSAALKTKTFDYIITNIKEIIKTPQFKKLNKSNPELYETIMTQVVEKRL